MKPTGPIALILWVACMTGIAVAQGAGNQSATTTLSAKELKRAAYGSLWRLNRAIERDGYYSARIALNVWRSNAIDAGLFDQSRYDQFKQQIYEKAIDNSLACFEQSLQNQSHYDAKMCLHTYKIRSEEIDQFDPAKYEAMQQQLQDSASTQE